MNQTKLYQKERKKERKKELVARPKITQQQ